MAYRLKKYEKIWTAEQSLSFPSVFRAIERTSRERTSGEWWAARSAGAEKRKKKETAVVFLIFSICRLWHLFDWWFRPVCKLIPFRGKVIIVNNSSLVVRTYLGLFVMFISFYADAKQSALEIRTSSRLLHEIHKPSTYREMWANFLRDKL